jgi:pSer/pThr/pTyr-binding forkhead associated (FHA) protein
VIAHDRCCRHHCEIFWQRNRWIVCDLESSNGTYLNGQRSSGAVPISMGDQLRIAHSVFRLTSSVVEIDGQSLDAPGTTGSQDNMKATMFDNEQPNSL